jgi:uncharacterized protein YjiS (DUF1127 family)
MRRSTKILGQSAGKYVRATSATTPRPSPDPAASYRKDQGIAEIVEVQPRGLAALPVPEAAHGRPPSWGSRVFGTALTSCRRLIVTLQIWHDDIGPLDDHLLRDIGLLGDQIQSPLLAGLFANRSYGVRSNPHELDDHLRRDIGLLRDQIQPPLLAGLFANRSDGARRRGAQGSSSRTLRGRK